MTAQRTVAIIQARTGSTRLPGKVLLPLLGMPMLARVVRRTRRAALLDGAVVATSTRPSDDPIEALARSEGWPVSRGSETDVLGRYLVAAREHDADVVVRITADCPLIDPAVIDLTIDTYRRHRCDYASNFLEPRTFPRGLDVEVFDRRALEAADAHDDDPASREHVSPFIYRNPERFRLRPVYAEQDWSVHRWSVDTPEDLELVERIYDAFQGDDFTWSEVLDLLAVHPEWVALNRHVVQKAVPPSHAGDR